VAILAYIRVSTSSQDTDGQRLEILEYARRNGLHIDDYIEIEASSRLTQRERRIEELLARLRQGDTLIVSELSRLGRSTVEVIEIANGLVVRKIGLVAIKQGLKVPAGGKLDISSKVMVSIFSLLAELERDLISERTKQALAAKKAGGAHLGKPTGTIQASKLDAKQDAIKELLQHKVSIAAIARVVGTSRSNLAIYISKRGIKCS
jgi:DNA invertase Pin-like site-specific DNA recombinase